MTVIVGILCEDGVMLGSDSSATLSVSDDLRTIEQPIKKTLVISDHILMAGTGQGGLSQRFEHVLMKVRTAKKFEQSDPFDISKTICAETIADFGATNCDRGQFGALVAFQSIKGCHLCEFALRDFQPEFKTPEQWFASMGSGQLITDPLLAMLRRVLFKDTRPKLREGLFAATWALQHAIELNPGGINAPIQLGVLRCVGQSRRMTAALLNDDELDRKSVV